MAPTPRQPFVNEILRLKYNRIDPLHPLGTDAVVQYVGSPVRG